MSAPLRLSALFAAAVLAAGAAHAQQKTDGSDYNPVYRNSPPSAEIDASARVGSPGTVMPGQTTAAPMTNGSVSREAVSREAQDAMRAGGTELPGQSMAAPPMRSAAMPQSSDSSNR